MSTAGDDNELKDAWRVKRDALPPSARALLEAHLTPADPAKMPWASSTVELEHIGDVAPLLDALESVFSVRPLRIDATHVSEENDTFGFFVSRTRASLPPPPKHIPKLTPEEEVGGF